MRTVVFICEHQQEGSMGFVLNRQFEQTMDELITDFEGYPVPVYYGGPVQMDTIHFLHQYPDLVPGGMEIMKGVYWGGDFEVLTSLVKNKEVDITSRYESLSRQNVIGDFRFVVLEKFHEFKLLGNSHAKAKLVALSSSGFTSFACEANAARTIGRPVCGHQPYFKLSRSSRT